MPKTFTVNGDRVELFAPLMKFDQRTGEFKAWASVEEVDSHGEICDIEKSWPAIYADAQQQLEISQGKSTGVVRRQHRRDTVIGKETLIERRANDAGIPGIYIEGVCTDEQSKEDAATGVLTGVSIRGLATRWPDEQNANVMRYAWTLREESSLVDKPAVPHALIEVMKSDGGIEMVEGKGRQPVQFWDCGNGAACKEKCKHAKKEEAMKCEALPSRVEAMKSLYSAADLISVLSMLMCVADDAEWNALWDQVDAQREGEQPDESTKAVVAKLKAIAGQLFDALQAMLDAEKAKLVAESGEEAATAALADGEMAMSLAMRALAAADDASKAQLREIAKHFTTSLRVPSGNGSINNTEKEGTMKDPKDLKKDDAPDPAKQMEELLAAVKDIQATLADVSTRVKALEDAKPDASVAADTAKAAAATATQVTALAAQVAELTPKIDELAKSHEDLGKHVETVIGALPVQRKGVLRAVDKADETTEKAKSEDGDGKTGNVWIDGAKRLA